MIVGRKAEQKSLEKVYRSKEAEFVVVYGRRRVGKTYLVRQFFARKKCVYFQATGSHKGNLKKQLTNFVEAVSRTFLDNISLNVPKDWEEAFKILNKQLSKIEGKVVLFFDELPWMATRRSGLLEAIDYYWNQYWSTMPNLILIACGSSASWLIKKIIYNKGGLHNRVTCQIRLSPFQLFEVEEYLKNRNIELNHQHILALYMALGGIPYYLRYVEPGQTAQQTIQNLFFEKEAPLSDEFSKLFHSLFENAQSYIELIELVSQKKQGLQRSELNRVSKLSSHGGRLSARLKDLCETGFIEEYVPWGKIKGEYYKLADEFCLFYLRWVKDQKNQRFSVDYWMQQSQKSSYNAWAGYAFEAVCMKHINQIISALKIKTSSRIGAWQFFSKKGSEDKGAQIDLIIDRNDNAMNVCEIKHTLTPFVIDKQYAQILSQKIKVFKEKTKVEKQLFLSMVTTNGLKETMYAEEMVQGVVVLDDLFISS